MKRRDFVHKALSRVKISRLNAALQLSCQGQQRRSGSVQRYRSRTACIRNNRPRPGGHECNDCGADRFAANLNNTGYSVKM